MIPLMRHFLIVIVALLLGGPATGADSDFRITDARRIVVVADVHGGYQELLSVLRATTVIDDSLQWRGGETHLVSLGDLLDRGPGSREVLDLLMRLEREARDAGGAVHVILGNHEVMNIVGDLRYVSASEYAAYSGSEDTKLREAAWERVLQQDPAASRDDFGSTYPAGYFGHQQAFSPNGHYGAWLLTKPFLLAFNDTAFVHAGLSSMVARLGLEATNQTLHSQLAEYLRTWDAMQTELNLARPIAFLERPGTLASLGAEVQSKTLTALQDEEIFTPKGPTWYRGQALCYPYTELENLEASLAKLGVSRVVEGHTVSPTGRALSRFDGRVILLDTGMLQSVYKGSPAALVFENGQWSVTYTDRPGQQQQPEVLSRAVGLRPAGLDDDALEQWLQQAEVVKIEDLDTGITKPQRVTLRKDGVELHAVFKQLSTDFGFRDPAKALNESDRFQYEIAAYKLDRLLGLDMVPVTVPRTLNSHRGVLQFWVEDAINVRKMLEQGLQPSGWCPQAPQYNLMNVFDILIHNTDRTQENAIFTKDWMLVLIDHSRAFPTLLKKPVLLYREETRVPPALAERLQTLNREMLQEALGPYLHRRQIGAILKRRDQLLDEYRARLGDGDLSTP